MKQNDERQRNAVSGSFLNTVTSNGINLFVPYISYAKNSKMSHPERYSRIEVTRWTFVGLHFWQLLPELTIRYSEFMACGLPISSQAYMIDKWSLPILSFLMSSDSWVRQSSTDVLCRAKSLTRVPYFQRVVLLPCASMWQMIYSPLQLYF